MKMALARPIADRLHGLNQVFLNGCAVVLRVNMELMQPLRPIQVIQASISQEIIQNIPDFQKSEVIIGNDVEEQISVVKRKNFHV